MRRPRPVRVIVKQWDESSHPRNHGQFAASPGGGASASSAPPSSPKPTPHATAALASLPVPAADRHALPKIKATFHAVYAAAYNAGVNLGFALNDIAPAILDTSEDYMNGKAGTFGDSDAWKMHTGISWGLTRTIVEHAAKAAFAVAGKVAKKALGAGQVDAAVGVLVAVLKAVHEQLKLPGGVDEDEVRGMLAKRLQGA